MPTFLFDQTIFGPVISRRLGISLGINLLPVDSKMCSFDCIYCECGWNPPRKSNKVVLPSRETVKSLLRQKLLGMAADSQSPDVITFAGNGEPTLHPEFDGIIEDTLELRDAISPKSRIAVLSNSTTLQKPRVVEALKRVDDNILKLDSGVPDTIILLNKPVGRFDLKKLVHQLKQFNGALTIQTMFLRGTYNGLRVDNTTDYEVEQWIILLKEIKPGNVMIYSIARDTPAENLFGVPVEELEEIASRVESETSIPVQVSA